jgi:phosphoglycolate phosphatase-like HAD superfamily hydrolase
MVDNVLPQARFPRAVLFDLDGTLLDSAPDMLATVNQMLASRSRQTLALEQLRPVVSKGARAMLATAFPEFPELADASRDALVTEFLHRYQHIIGQHSRLPAFAPVRCSGSDAADLGGGRRELGDSHQQA